MSKIRSYFPLLIVSFILFLISCEKESTYIKGGLFDNGISIEMEGNYKGCSINERFDLLQYHSDSYYNSQYEEYSSSVYISRCSSVSNQDFGLIRLYLDEKGTPESYQVDINLNIVDEVAHKVYPIGISLTENEADVIDYSYDSESGKINFVLESLFNDEDGNYKLLITVDAKVYGS